MQITIGRVPGELNRLDVRDNASVADALTQANLSVGAGESVNVNGTVIGSDALGRTTLAANATVMLTRQVKGN